MKNKWLNGKPIFIYKDRFKLLKIFKKKLRFSDECDFDDIVFCRDMDGVGSPDGVMDPSMLDLRYPTPGAYSPKISYESFHSGRVGSGDTYSPAHFSAGASPHPLYSTGFGLQGLMKSELWGNPGYSHVNYGLTSSPGIQSANSV